MLLRFPIAAAAVIMAGCSSSSPVVPDAGQAMPDAKPSGPFPTGFLWGAATAAHQAESAGQAASDWSIWEKIPGRVKNGDLAANGPDEWDHYDDDFALARSLGHNAYRFSLDWARIEPTQGTFDEAAIAHYRAMITSMQSH